jgi:hypothetical protein
MMSGAHPATTCEEHVEIVHQEGNIIDAHLIRNALALEGIVAFVSAVGCSRLQSPASNPQAASGLREQGMKLPQAGFIRSTPTLRAP